MNLEKLKRATFDELRVRAAQKVAAFNERRGWSSLTKLPSNVSFPSPLNSDAKFFAGFHSLETTANELKSRWPATAQRLVDKADRICDGRFDLLGFTNLNFGDPIDWHFEPVSGKRIPLQHWSKLDYLDVEVAGDKKIIWELNRQQYFMTLGQAYCLTGDEKYARVFAAHLDAWMDANPPKLGVNWASSLEVAFRSMSWLWGFHFFKSSPSLSTETFNRALKFLYLSARHLESYLSTYFSPNTHLTGEALGLFYLGTLLPEFKEARRWQELGREILIEQLPIHVQRDGVYFEQSSYYHRYTTDFYLHFLLLSRANNLALPPQVEKSLLLLLDHLMYITRPDGTTPFFGDDDGGRLAMLDDRAANDFRGTLGTGAVVFNRGDYKFVADGAAEELLWLTGVEGLNRFDSIDAVEPAKTSVGFDEGGYFVMRDCWTRESNYLLFDCGPHGALNCGHAHADALSIDVAANGRTMLVDPGTYTYTGSKELRDWFRGSHAHNTIAVEGDESSIPDAAFTWKTKADCRLFRWFDGDGYDLVAGAHDSLTRLQQVDAQRSILFVKENYWVVCDRLRSSGDHRANIQFHFDSDLAPVLNGAVREPQMGFTIQCFGNGNWVEEEAHVSHCYGQKKAAKAFVFSAKLGESSGDVISFLLPQKAESEWRVHEIEARGGRAFAVYGAKTLDLVMIRREEYVETRGFKTDLDWLWVRFSNGQRQEPIICLGKGSLPDNAFEALGKLCAELME